MAAMLRLLCVVGFVLAAYALYVEEMSKSHPGFVALCDISSGVSCSKVFSSPYGHMLFGQPNALFGAVYYVAMLIGTSGPFSHHAIFYQLVLLASGGAAAFSVLLAILLRKLGDFCILCMATWVVNFALLYLSWTRLGAFMRGGKAGTKTKGA